MRFPELRFVCQNQKNEIYNFREVPDLQISKKVDVLWIYNIFLAFVICVCISFCFFGWTCLDHLGVILGSFWDHFGIMLVFGEPLLGFGGTQKRSGEPRGPGHNMISFKDNKNPIRQAWLGNHSGPNPTKGQGDCESS